MGVLGKRKQGPKTWRRKKAYRKSTAVVPRRVRGNINTAVHSFKRLATTASISGNAAYIPYSGATNINLSVLPSYTEFVNLFDQFRITYVVIKFWLKVDPSAQAAASAIYPKLYWTRDVNSSTPITQNTMRERGDVKIAVLHPNRPVVMKFKPNLLTQNLLNGTGSSYTPAYNQWISTADNTAFYYGALWNIDNLTNTNFIVDVESTYYFQCKNLQ